MFLLLMVTAVKAGNLEERVEMLENKLAGFEEMLVSRYGLVRNCEIPAVINGEAECAEKLKPGSTCSVLCNPGYIATPGKTTTSCKENGFWTIEMQCEIPLLLVSGGSENQGDVTSDLMSLVPSTGCDRSLPDMPRSRKMHNLVYLPGKPGSILACNGMTDEILASCDVFSFSSYTWSAHSYPNKAITLFDSLCETSSSPPLQCKDSPDRKKGRYASQTLHIGDTTIIAGGMLYDSIGHDPSNTVRVLSMKLFGKLTPWDKHRQPLNEARAFFCAINIKDGAYLSIGGLGKTKKGNVIHNSVELHTVGWNGIKDLNRLDFSDMKLPRSGLGCTVIPSKNFSIMAAGGTKGFDQHAIQDTEIFNWQSNEWRTAANMNTGRFGHAVVTIGDRVFAIGGDDRKPSNILDTIEEYDLKSNTWKIIKKKLKVPRSNFGYTLVPHSIFKGCTVTRPLTE